MDMRDQDAALAHTFLLLRKDIQLLKLQRSTDAHKVTLYEAIDMEDERDELSQHEHGDLPTEQFSPKLKPLGITRMNVAMRRFSVL
jgi:hypothetical protein